MFETSRPVKTERMTLRPYEMGDVEALHAMFGREDVCRYLMWPPMDLDQARAKVEERVQQTHVEVDRDALLFAAVEDATGRMIGEFMLRVASLESRQGEIGWSLHPDVHGRGLATEGARELLRLGFDDLQLHRIVADTDPRNVASIRVMEHLGMRREAEFLENMFLKGEWTGEVVYALLEDEWRAGR
ncbi:MAG: N-acetyltransferase [Chloroflexota bacterium]|nr:MAG: N-acetyltransferase [Chloroflexota bacterium]